MLSVARASEAGARGVFSLTPSSRRCRLSQPQTFTPEALELMKRASAFLYSIKSINVSTLRPEAIEASWTEQVLKERNVEAPK